MEKISVQYLIGFKSKVPFCKSQKTFLNLLNSLDNTLLEKGSKIKYKDIQIIYRIRTIDKKDESIKYFDLALTIVDENHIEKFVEFLSSFKKLLISIASTPIETIWNDVGLYYSNKAYPLVYDIENLMRMLITKFMILKVGMEWTKERVPDEVKKSLRKDVKDIKSNYLSEVDFIQLSNFLFKKYSDKDITEFYKAVENKNNMTIAELSNYVPKSNWDRYFSEIVSCDDNYILKRWEKLYKLRCKIAHNNDVIKADYEEISKLIQEIRSVLETALDKLSEISITEIEKEEISVNFARSKNENMFYFLNSYNKIQKSINDIAKIYNIQQNAMKSINYSKILLTINKINDSIPYDVIEKVSELQKYRNYIVHSYNSYIDNDEILLKTEELEKVVDEVQSINFDEEKEPCSKEQETKDDENLEIEFDSEEKNEDDENK